MPTVPIRLKCALVPLLALAGASQAAHAAPPDAAAVQPLGIFEAHADIGQPKLAGNAAYAHHRYTLTAGGANVFGAHDEFHFVWRKVKGDFSIRARVSFDGPGVEPHRKSGIMARAALDDASPYVDATVHGSGPNALQLRAKEGGDTQMLVAMAPGAAGPGPGPGPAGSPAGGPPAAAPSPPPPKLVELARHGNHFTATISEQGKPPQVRDVVADLPPVLYVGLYLCAHDADVREQASFDGVRLTAR